MTDNQNITIKFELPQVVNEALKPLASSIGITLSNIWDGTFMGVNTWYQKKSIEKENNLLLYEKQLQKNMSSIKEENLQEPKMSIVGPALEASKFYFEEAHFREMFSKLLAAACDNSKNNYIHPSFTEIIKQLDHKDATVLIKFQEHERQPICNYMAKYENGTTHILKNVFFLENIYDHRDLYSSSITNLKRLGLIDTDYIYFLANNELYEFALNDPYLNMMNEYIHCNVGDRFKECTVEKGTAFLTPLGEDFIKICL